MYVFISILVYNFFFQEFQLILYMLMLSLML